MNMKGILLGIVIIGIIASAYFMMANGDYAIVVKTDKHTYSLNEEIHIWIEIKDYDSKNIKFPSSKIADFSIYKGEEKLYQWSENRSFLQVITSINLSKGMILLETTIPANMLGIGTFEIRAWMEKFYENGEIHPEVYAKSISFSIS